MPIGSILGVILVCTVWGAGFSFMKIALRYLPPFCFAGLRFLLTAAFVALYMRLMRIEWRVPRGMWRRMAVLTVLFYAQQGLIFLGMTYTRAGRAGVILNTQPIITAFAAHWFMAHDRLTWGKIAGMLMAICGVGFVFRESFTVFSQSILIGDALVLLAAIFWGTQTIVAKHVVKHVTPAAMIYWQAAVASLLFFLTSLLFDPQPIPKQALDAAFLGATAYIVLVSTVFGFVAWVHLLERSNPSQMTSFCFVTPIASLLFARLILGESLTPDIALATLLVGAGIFVANFRFRSRNGESCA